MAGLKVIPAYVRMADDFGLLELALRRISKRRRPQCDGKIAISYRRLRTSCNLPREGVGRAYEKRSEHGSTYFGAC
jgi:ParB family chromosome partitioning protein